MSGIALLISDSISDERFFFITLLYGVLCTEDGIQLILQTGFS